MPSGGPGDLSVMRSSPVITEPKGARGISRLELSDVLTRPRRYRLQDPPPSKVDDLSHICSMVSYICTDAKTRRFEKRSSTSGVYRETIHNSFVCRCRRMRSARLERNIVNSHVWRNRRLGDCRLLQPVDRGA